MKSILEYETRRTKAEAFERAVCVLYAVGTVTQSNAEQGTLSGKMSTRGRTCDITITLEEYGDQVTLEITASTHEVMAHATNLSLDHFVEAFERLDEPGYVSDISVLPERLIIFLVASFLGVMLIGIGVYAILFTK